MASLHPSCHIFRILGNFLTAKHIRLQNKVMDKLQTEASMKHAPATARMTQEAASLQDQRKAPYP